ncbi:MAG: hypothetical protein Q8Q92_04035, partial [bacterium]|nr:hypothetical protein [bacterium]
SNMNENIKNELAKRAIFRAQSGLYFLQDVVLPHIQSGTDAAYSRSAYILLSFNTELVLNALFILGSKKTSEADIMKDLVSASKSHNLENLFNRIPKESRFGIQSAVRKNVNGFVRYDIKLNNSVVTVEDFTDVRYDFKKNALRSINQNEGTALKDSTSLLLDFVRKIISNSINFDIPKKP